MLVRHVLRSTPLAGALGARDKQSAVISRWWCHSTQRVRYWPDFGEIAMILELHQQRISI
jgi:hypothetical protein